MGRLRLIPEPILRLGQGLSSFDKATFSPASISDLQIWLDASQIGGLSDGDAVGTWSDLSGNGYHATETGTARPTYKTNILNGRPVVRFDGVNNFMQLTNTNLMVIDDTLTFFIVYKTTSTARQCFFGSSSGGSFSIEIFDTANCRTVSTPGVFVARTNAIVKDLVFEVLTYARSGPGAGTHRFLVDGALQSLQTDGAGAFSANVVKQLGRRSAGALVFAGDMAEVILYGSALADADRIAVERYLTSKYGITYQG